ncbi:MAG: ATP-binding protein [Halobacteriovoraceae bacterium]|nr:ATP-binding protein [Peredibacter sp.]MBI99672.1 ATP-binding protein [Halobacteriovoraceae bacterium]|tara:strand:+ start:869 stop:1816 length:948 start_codon:yes stop_codon:yes gene_type:complete
MSIINDLNNNELLSHHRKCKIWAIGGGKGGVGKSLVTANTSICLALMGYKVVTVDLDLGGANMHTCLGVPIPEKTLSDYVSKKVTDINDLLVSTPIKNLQIISGAQDELGIANLRQMHKNKILSKLGDLDADYVLLDLGAGTSYNTLDFFISADKGALVILPEPTSIENTYRFIKSVYHRRLKMIEELLDIQPLINQAMNSKLSTPQNTPVELVKKVIEINPEMGQKLQREISKFRPKIIMNQVRSQNDIDIGFSIQNVCKRYFGINIDYVGYLDYDASVWQSVKKRRPLLMEFPNSKLVNNFDRMVQKMLDMND